MTTTMLDQQYRSTFFESSRKKFDPMSTSSVRRYLNNLIEQIDISPSGMKTSILSSISVCLLEMNSSILSMDVIQNSLLLLRQAIIKILQLWANANVNLNDNDCQLLYFIAKSLKRCFKYLPDKELESFCQYLCDSTLLETVADCLRIFANTDRLFQDDHHFPLKSFIRFLRLYEKDCYAEGSRWLLFKPIQQCLLSHHYFHLFNKVSLENKTISTEQKLFLIKIPHIFCRLEEKEIEFIAEQVLNNMILKYITLLENFTPSVSRWNRLISRSIYYLLLIMDHPASNVTDTRTLVSQHPALIQCLLRLLENLTRNKNSDAQRSTVLIELITSFLVNMIVEPSILDQVKELPVTETFLRLTSSEDRKVALNAHTLIACATSEKDIESMKNPGRLLSIIIESLKHEVNQPPGQYKNIDQLLRILKGLVQHEKIKDECMKENFLPILIDFSDKLVDDRLIQIIEILWTLSFREDIAASLRSNKRFVEHIQKLSNTETNPALKKASDGMIWKLVREPKVLKEIDDQPPETVTEEVVNEHGQTEFITKMVSKKDPASSEQTFQYDMMISYCHADKELTYKIHKFLCSQGFKIWIDLDSMFGPAMSAMAEAVENSEFVIMCMSDSYKNSTYCQAEAEYAFNRKRRLLPLIVRRDYRPDGWLGFLIGSRIYIDFGRFDFDKACDKLINEIKLQRKRPLPPKLSEMKSIVGHTQVEQETDSFTVETTGKHKKTLTSEQALLDKYKERRISTEFRLKPINTWTDSDVLDFLASQRLIQLMLIFETMDGPSLIHLYKMSKLKDEHVYKILNDELKSRFRIALPIAVYLRFINAMEHPRFFAETPIIDETMKPSSILSSSKATVFPNPEAISNSFVNQRPTIQQTRFVSPLPSIQESTYRRQRFLQQKPVFGQRVTFAQQNIPPQQPLSRQLSCIEIPRKKPYYDFEVISDAPAEQVIRAIISRCRSANFS